MNTLHSVYLLIPAVCSWRGRGGRGERYLLLMVNGLLYNIIIFQMEVRWILLYADDITCSVNFALEDGNGEDFLSM